jgi:hypothetical protein
VDAATLEMVKEMAFCVRSIFPWSRYYPILAELDDPKVVPDAAKRTAVGRLEVFDEAARHADWCMKRIKARYLQPYVDLADYRDAKKPRPGEEPRPEKEMYLVLFLHKDKPFITKRQYGRMLDFIARCYSAAQFDPHEFDEYRRYLLDDWKQRVLSQVRGPDTEPIELVRFVAPQRLAAAKA